jgi:hypothetical protein
MRRITQSRRGKVARDLLLIVVIIACLAGVTAMQRERFGKLEFKAELFRQRIKLPSAEVLRFVSLGYDSVYANWLWLQSIQAFGSGWITEDRSTEPIYQYFDTMTDLDPHFIPSYRFGNLIIGDNRFDWERGQRLLRKGIIKNPLNYDLPYLGMYNGIFMTGDLQDARFFSAMLRRTKNPPEFMLRMEEYIERKDGRFEAAFEINVRYYLRYIAQNNEIENDIIERRMISVLDKLNRKKIADAAYAYAEKHGSHPTRMEDILQPEYLPPFESPTIPRFSAALEKHAAEIDLLGPTTMPSEDLIAAVAKDSKTMIHGLPPEPNGTWYFFSTPANEFFHRVRDVPGAPRDEDLHYLRSALEVLQEMNHHMLKAQNSIMEHHRKNSSLPTDEQLGNLLGRDGLGGRFVYQREAPESPVYGVFFSSAARRIDDRKEPRVGLYGPGPFPFSIEPSLADHEDDRLWGIQNGFILPDGTELWYKAADEPKWDEERQRYIESLAGNKPAEESEESATKESTEQ